MNKDFYASHRRLFKSIILISIVLIVLHVAPVPPVGEPVESLTAKYGDHSRFRDILVHYIDRGEGNRLYVLLHGFGASVYTWREIVSNLSGNGRVFAFDRPGFGLTERADPSKLSVNPYSPVGAADFTCDLLKTIRRNESEIVLIGHSAGGGIALLVALRCDIELKALVLIAPAWRPYTQSIPERVLFNIPLADKYGPLLVRLMVTQLENMLHKAYYNKSALTSDVIDGYKYPLRARDWDKGLYWIMKYREYPDVTGELARIRIPVLIIHGVQDEIVKVDDSMRLYDILSQYTYTELVTIDECGHLPHEEKPQLFLDELYVFLERT